MKLRVALVVSHPVQHFCPQYVSFAANGHIIFKVFFASMLGYKKYTDPHFGKEISWGNLELDKFEHDFLNGEEVIPVDGKLDAPSLNQALDNFKPGLVISYGYYQSLQRRAHRWANRNKIPLAYISDSEQRQTRSRLKELIKYPFLRWYFSGIRFFFTVGDANESFYRYYGVPAKKLIRMHFPIDVKNYQQQFHNILLLRNKIRQQYLLTDDDIVLCVVGKLVSWKNQNHLIDALRILEERNRVLHLFMIGSGDRQADWEKEASCLKKSKVHFTGFISIDQLPAYYAAADIYVHPAMVEPHSIAVSEAIYMGCPVIVSDTSGSYGVSDDVQEGKNGLVYPFGDLEALCACIERLAGNKALRSSFSSYSHQLGVAFQQQAHEGIVSDFIKRIPDFTNQKNAKNKI